MKAIFIYNPSSGKGKFSKYFPRIKKELASTFSEMLFFCPENEKEAIHVYENEVSNCDALIVMGGDGSLNLAINELMKLNKKPILGYINAGTLGDGGKNFGVNKSLNDSLNIIKSMNVKKIDVGEVTFDDRKRYFLYCLAYGTYSSIPYVVKKKTHMRKFAYYFRSSKEMFKKKTFHFVCEENETIFEKDSPFIMFLNGVNMGGFKLNKETKLDDGIIEGYFPKQSPFNGVLRFLPFKKEKARLIKNIKIKPTDDGYWCLDGEKGGKGEVTISVISNEISIFSR